MDISGFPTRFLAWALLEVVPFGWYLLAGPLWLLTPSHLKLSFIKITSVPPEQLLVISVSSTTKLQIGIRNSQKLATLIVDICYLSYFLFNEI